MEFKIGDKVKINDETFGIKKYEIGTIINRGFWREGFHSWIIYWDINTPDMQLTEEHLILVDEQNKQQDKSMNIKEQFLLAITSEPQKSFRKAGITNGDDLLTDDGQKVFLSWLLKLNQDAFKKEVVDPILEDMKDEKK